MSRSILLLLLLLFAAACNQPGHKQGRDKDFDILFTQSKQYVNSAHYPDSALMILRELLREQNDEEKAANRGKVLNIMGVAYDMKGKYDSAAYYLYEASQLAERIKDDSLQMSVYSNLGILQFALKNAGEAVKYYQQSLVIAEKMKDSISIANQLNNIGNTYMTLINDFEKAVPYLEQCVKVSRNIGYTSGVKVAGINLAMIYNELGKPDKALNELDRLTDNYGENIYADFLRGVIYQGSGNQEKALHEWKMLLTKRLNTREFELQILQNIAESYKTSGNPDSTVIYIEKLYTLKDSLHNRQSDEMIQNLKIAYETEKKEIQITTLKGEKTLMIWLGLSGGTILLLALFTFLFLWRWTVQKKRLADSRREFAEQQIKQLEQEKQLIATQAVLEGEVQERIRLARDLHDGLGSILAAAKYNLIDFRKKLIIDDTDSERFDKSLALLDDSMREMRRVAHHLMPESLGSSGLKQSIADFCASIPIVKFSYYGDDTRVDTNLEVMIYRIMHELVSNVLKHSGASRILVEIAQNTEDIFLTVQDNGCGFDPAIQSEGMGLKNIKTRVAACNGNVNIHSLQGEGTEINVKFPVIF